MKVLFVIPKNKFVFFGYRGVSPTFPHLGVAYLIAMLQREGHEVKLFDEGAGLTQEDMFKLIADFKPQLIGITIYTLSRNFAYELIEKIKERINIPVVIGGAHVSTIKSLALEETRADFAIVYEGEYPLIELARELESATPHFSDVKNLIWHSSSGIIENPVRPYLTDLDALPFPQFDLYDIKPHPAFGERLVPLVTSRGCPFACNFCSVKLYMGRGFRKRSAENVFEEIEYQYAKGYHQFDFNDDCFTLDRARAEKLLDAIIASGMKVSFQFYNGLRADTVDSPLLKKLKSAGCFYISYGCESGNAKILKNIKKAITLDQVRQATRWTREAGIACSVNFIIGHKEETYETAMDSVRFARTLPTNFVNFYNLIPYPGTEAYDWVKAHGRFLVDTGNYLEAISYGDNKPVFETPELTRQQREKIMRIGFSIHEKKVLGYRFGWALGTTLFYLTRARWIKIFAARFATMNKLGNKLAVLLSKGSYERYTKGKKKNSL